MYRRNACYRLIPYEQLHTLSYPCGKYSTARTLCSMLNKCSNTNCASVMDSCVHTNTGPDAERLKKLLARRDATTKDANSPSLEQRKRTF